eukprot:752541-Hanusia_phi.AAC.2
MFHQAGDSSHLPAVRSPPSCPADRNIAQAQRFRGRRLLASSLGFNRQIMQRAINQGNPHHPGVSLQHSLESFRVASYAASCIFCP